MKKSKNLLIQTTLKKMFKPELNVRIIIMLKSSLFASCRDFLFKK